MCVLNIEYKKYYVYSNVNELNIKHFLENCTALKEINVNMSNPVL